MNKHRHEIGADCWLVLKGYGHQLYRVRVLAKITQETEDGISLLYRVKLSGGETECPEASVFSTTQAHEALCLLEVILSTPKL